MIPLDHLSTKKVRARRERKSRRRRRRLSSTCLPPVRYLQSLSGRGRRDLRDLLWVICCLYSSSKAHKKRRKQRVDSHRSFSPLLLSDEISSPSPPPPLQRLNPAPSQAWKGKLMKIVLPGIGLDREIGGIGSSSWILTNGQLLPTLPLLPFRSSSFHGLQNRVRI